MILWNFLKKRFFSYLKMVEVRKWIDGAKNENNDKTQPKHH